MAKQLDEKTILNELHGESAFFRPTSFLMPEPSSRRISVTKRKAKALQQDAAEEAVHPHADAIDKKTSQLVDRTVDRTTDPSYGQPAGASSEHAVAQPGTRFIGQSDDPLVSESTAHAFDLSPILPRPKAFYITEMQDEELDILVKKLAARVKGKVEQKIDRSVATRLIYESMDLTRDETVTRLAKLMISRLASQLTNQPMD